MNLSFQKIEAVSKKTLIVSQLREAIVSGAIDCGEQVVESKLAQQFGVGQGLIREALIQLEHEGFVQRTPFSGTRVSMLRFEEVKQIFAIRIELEPLAFCLAVKKGATETDLEELNTIAQKTRTAFESKDLGVFFGSQLEFRKKIWQLSANAYLQQALERVVIPVYALYLVRSTYSHDSFAACVEHQSKILGAFGRKDAEEARLMARVFLERMIEHLATSLAPESKDN